MSKFSSSDKQGIGIKLWVTENCFIFFFLNSYLASKDEAYQDFLGSYVDITNKNINIK